MKTKTITFDRFIRGLLVVVGVAFVYLLLLRLSSVLIPFFVAWLVAYMIYPVVIFFQYKCRLRSRILSIVIALALVIGAIVGAGFLIVPPVIEEVARLKDIIVSYLTSDSAVTAAEQLENYVKHNVDLNDFAQAITFNDVSTFLEERIPQVIRLMHSGINVVIGIVASFIAVLYLFFILMDYEQMSRGFIKMFPRSQRRFVSDVLNDVEVGMNGYFRGQSLIAFIVGILFSIGFVIIGLPLAIPLGLFIGFLNLVPYLQTLGFIPTVVLALIKSYDTGDNFWVILASALAVFAIVQTIQDAYLTPRIMGKVTGLNAAVILLSLSVWGSLLGFIGLIIALPLTTLIVSYYKRFVLEESPNANVSADER